MEMFFNEINEAYCSIVEMFQDFLNAGSPIEHSFLKRSTSRNGDVIRFKEPVTIHYRLPCERVLLSPDRNENPFFHLYEALWMLNGNDNVAPLAALNSNMVNYSDDGETFNGAYGKRWRHAMPPYNGGLDQIYLLIKHLEEQPDSRRAVLQMWSVKKDLLKIEGAKYHDQFGVNKEFSKDVCCNTACFFDLDDGILNMSITNRSNDAIWGLLGANYVHFSFLQEYVAAHLKVKIGRMTVFSNNVHTYVDKFNSTWNYSYVDKFLHIPAYEKAWVCNKFEEQHQSNTKEGLGFTCETWSNLQIDTFDEQLGKFVYTYDLSKATFDNERELRDTKFKHGFLENVAKPMMLAFYNHKKGQYLLAADYLVTIRHKLWFRSAARWLRQRWIANGTTEAVVALNYLRENEDFQNLEKDLELISK